MTPIERFAVYIIGRPLYPYQAEVANAILHSIDHNLGWIITVMMSRQSGKNQINAIIKAFLLSTEPALNLTNCLNGTAIPVHFDSYEESIRDLHSQIISLATGGSASASYKVKIVLVEA